MLNIYELLKKADFSKESKHKSILFFKIKEQGFSVI